MKAREKILQNVLNPVLSEYIAPNTGFLFA